MNISPGTLQCSYLQQQLAQDQQAWPGDCGGGAMLSLLSKLQPIKQAGQWSLDGQGGDVKLDQRRGRHPDLPHTHGVGGVWAWMVGGADSSLWLSQDSSTFCKKWNSGDKTKTLNDAENEYLFVMFET